jgi:two-component system, NtrC family, response regulator HydG
MKVFAKKYKKSVSKISQASIKKLNQYSWPGNVRELQHALERAVIMCEASVLEPDDFFLSAHRKKGEEFELENFNLEEVEKKIILKVIKQYQGNITKAAKELGLTRTSLYRRMEKYGL